MSARRERDRRSAVIVAGLALLMILAVLFTPEEDTSEIRPRLTTHSRDPGGAGGFHETAKRLGWAVARHERAELPPPRTDVVYAVLAPQIPLTAAETHALLQRVRAGSGLFAVFSGRSLLADSLGIRFRGQFGRVADDVAADCPPTRRRRALEALRGPIWSAGFEVTPPGNPRIEHFLRLEASSSATAESLTAAAGFPLGAGRVGVVADPDLLTNAVFRRCRLEAGVSGVQLLAYVASSERGELVRRRIVFDEYHHGYGSQPSLTRVATRFVSTHPVGRTMGQLSLAGMVLLLVIGSRPAAAEERQEPPRRSPLEHARALSLAYSQVSATRTATRLLVRGLRRRLRFTGSTTRTQPQSDEEFLDQVASRYPSLESDIAGIKRALTSGVGKEQLLKVGRAITTIERTVNRDIH